MRAKPSTARYWVALRLELVTRESEVAFVRQEVARNKDQAVLRGEVEDHKHGAGDFVLEERGGGFTHSRVELHVAPKQTVSDEAVQAYRRLAERRLEEAKPEPVEELFQPPPRSVPRPVAPRPPLGEPLAVVDAAVAISTAVEPAPATILALAPPAATPAPTAPPLSPENYAQLAREVRDAYALYDEALQRLTAQLLPDDYTARLGEAIVLAAQSIELMPETPPAPPPEIVPARTETDRGEVETPRLLRRLGPKRPLVIVGGTPVPEMIKRIGKWLGMTPEWITCERGQDRTTMPLAERISRGNVAAILVVEQLLSHNNANRIKLAAVASSTPYAYVNKAGIEAVRRGLRTIEAALEKRAS